MFEEFIEKKCKCVVMRRLDNGTFLTYRDCIFLEESGDFVKIKDRKWGFLVFSKGEVHEVREAKEYE